MDDLLDVEEIITKLSSSLPICRVCLDVSMEYIEFEATLCIVNGQEITFSEGFHELTPDNKDLPLQNMPTNFCATCGKDLLNAYLFIKRTQHANYALKKIKNLTKESSEVLANKHITDIVVNKDEISFSNSESESNVGNTEMDIIDDKPISKILETSNDSMKFEIPKEEQEDEEEVCEYEEVFNHEERPMEQEQNPIEPETQNIVQESDGWELDWNSTCGVTSMLVCNECGFLCETKEGLAKHISSSHGNGLIEINAKDSHMLFHEYLKRNLECEHKEKKDYHCNNCSCAFETKKSLNIHKVRTHKTSKTNDQKIQEDVEFEDDRKIVPEARMEKHLLTHSTEVGKDYSCTLCEKMFSTKIGLKQHSYSHSKNQSRYACHICGKICLRPSTLKKHIQYIHMSERKKYQCEECGLFFQFPSNLKDHRKKHNSTNQYQCTDCDRTFLRKPQLEIHMRYHLNYFPYKCDKCDKCYVTKSNLTDHIRSKHTKATFDCDKCKQKFKSQTGLRKHKYAHDGYPYTCPLCSVGQTSRSGMKQHLMGVHKDALTEEQFDKMFPIIIPRTGFRRPKDL